MNKCLTTQQADALKSSSGNPLKHGWEEFRQIQALDSVTFVRTGVAQTAG